MIAVWLVGPPSEVARPTISAGSRPAVSAGARSSANSTDGSSGTGTPGSGTPRISAMTRSRMSRRSVTRSAISPPSWVNIAANLSVAVAVTAELPLAIEERAAPSQPRSVAIAALADRTSEAAPVASSARPRSRAATAFAAASKTSFSASRSASATSPVSAGMAGRAPGRITRPYPTPGTTGVPCSVVCAAPVPAASTVVSLCPVEAVLTDPVMWSSSDPA